MALFEFELRGIADIVPWDSSDGPTLSWFALTDGTFWMPVGDQVLFEYDDQILRHWESTERTVDYQVAALARDVLGSMAAGLTSLPKRIEQLASDWERLSELKRRTDALHDDDDWSEVCYTAWRWLGERRPWASYFVAEPYFQFVRTGDLVHVFWDNHDRIIEGLKVWSATKGHFQLSAASFLAECDSFAARLLASMERRIEEIETGQHRAQAPLDALSLRQQHEQWRLELASYFREHRPDFEWPDVEDALARLAEHCSIRF